MNIFHHFVEDEPAPYLIRGNPDYKNRTVAIFVIIIILFSIMPSYVRCEEFIQGVAKLNNQLTDGSPVNIKVWSKKINSTYPYEKAFLWGGDYFGEKKIIMPKSIISKIDIKVRNEKIIVPLSAYSDLGNPKLVLFERTKQGFKLIIEGVGGEETAYKAILEFSGENIQRRRVMLKLFSQEVWQETVYSFVSKER
jgi:hypothetical protein